VVFVAVASPLVGTRGAAIPRPANAMRTSLIAKDSLFVADRGEKHKLFTSDLAA